MDMTLRTLAFTLTVLFFSSFPASAADLKCTECGMTVDLQSRFAAKITQGESTVYFCDIGDLLSHVTRKKLKEVKAEVRDYPTGNWIDARKAFYVHAGKKFSTPMGWGIGAFSAKDEASKSGTPLDFDGAVQALK